MFTHGLTGASVVLPNLRFPLSALFQLSLALCFVDSRATK